LYFKDGNGNFVPGKERQARIKFGLVLDLIEPVHSRVDGLDTSLYLIHRALKELAGVDKKGFDDFRDKGTDAKKTERIQAEADSKYADSLTNQEKYDEEDEKEDQRKDEVAEDVAEEKNRNIKDGGRHVSESTICTVTFEMLAQEWSDIQDVCTIKGISSAVLVEQAKATFEATETTLGEQLGGLFFRASAMFAEPAKCFPEFNDDDDEDDANDDEYTSKSGSTAEDLSRFDHVLDKLRQTFILTSPDDAMFYSNFTRGMSFMGKNLDRKMALKHFTAAISLARRYDQIVLRHAFSEYERDYFKCHTGTVPAKRAHRIKRKI